MEINFTEFMQLLILAAGVFVFWMSYRSFPPNETAQLLTLLHKKSQETDNKVDDLLVKVAMFLNEQRTQAEPPINPALGGGDGGELSPKSGV